MADQTGEMENDLSYLIISSFLVVITLFVCAYNFETSSSIHFGNQFMLRTFFPTQLSKFPRFLQPEREN